MKALVLVGGFGTRLRPLTLTLPKPLITFANKPMILHQIEALVKVGVKDIILAVNYRPETMVSHIKDYEEMFDIRITFSIEDEPLGTAGPLALARKMLTQTEEPFFVLNSDVICDFRLEEIMGFHMMHGREGTVLVTRVEDPQKYGVVVFDKETGEIERFVEKPQNFISNHINAGIYIFNPSMINRIDLKPTSIEKEVFPQMVECKELCAFECKGFWMDIGQPCDYLQGTKLYLEHIQLKERESLSSKDNRMFEKIGLAKGDMFIDPVMVHPSVTIGADCKIGPNVVLGPNVVIGKGVRISDSVVMENSYVESYSLISSSIVGWNCKIGSWSHLKGISVLGGDVSVSNEVYINGGCILPHKTVSSNITKPEIIM